MKIIFTQSKHPNLFSKAIASLEKSPWTHVLIETDLLFPETNEPFLFHSTWSGGFTLTPKKEMLSNRMFVEYEDGLALDWKLIRKLMQQYGGFNHYGWGQAIGHVFRALGLHEPKWLVERYKKEAYCSKLILLIWEAKNKKHFLDVDRCGPGELERYLCLSKQIPLS